jgi:DNA topoisomerase-1
MKDTDPATVDLPMALDLLALPREVGLHPEDSKKITAAIGRFGPYLRHNSIFYSLKGDDDVLSVGLNRAVTIIADSPKKDPPKSLGDHPKDKKPVTQRTGRWGPFVQHGKIRANIPKDMDVEKITLEEAVALIAAKLGGSKKAPAKKAATKKKPPKKKATKKASAKKKPAAKAKRSKPAESPAEPSS